MEDEETLGGDVAAALADIESGAEGTADADDDSGVGAAVSDASKELADDVTADGSAGQAEGEASPDAAATAAEPPSDFTAEEKEAFSKLTPEAQALVASYSNRSQVSRTTTAKELDGLRKQYGPIGDALKPYEQLIKQAGTTAHEVVGGLLPYYHRLVTGDAQTKRDTIDYLAKQFGVELGAPQQTEQKPDATNNEYVDPDLSALEKRIDQKLAKLEGIVTKTSGTLEERDMAEKQRVLDSAQAEVDAFRNEKDEKGQLKRPHFEKLEPVMSDLIKVGRAKTLEDAYKLASRLDDGIIAEEQKAKADAKRQEDAAKAAAAKKAAASNRKGDATPGKRSEGLSIMDSVREAFDELNAAV